MKGPRRLNEPLSVTCKVEDVRFLKFTKFSILILVKNFVKVGYLLPASNKNRQLYNQYARAKEADGDYKAALDAFTAISNVPEQTRLLLALQQVPQAISLIRSTGNSEGAQLVAMFFEGIGQHANVVEFWLMAGRKEDAFRVAQANGLVPHYAELLQKLDMATKDDCKCTFVKNVMKTKL